MSLPKRLPPSILGGDPFNQFRYLYRQDLWWKLHDERYCLSVMRAAYQAGGRAFDLSFDVNVRLFRRLLAETGDRLLGFGNPSWEQGVILDGRFIQFSRDRIIRTLVDRRWPARIAKQVEEDLSHRNVLVFGYDRKAPPLSDEEIGSIYLDEAAFRRRLAIFDDCRFICFGGSDADWLVSLGRIDVVEQMAGIVHQEGFIAILLCHYATLVIPQAESHGLQVQGYAVPLNRAWSWFDRDACVDIVRSLDKPVIAFMPLASGDLREDIRGALDWLYAQVGVESILFGTGTARHARETTRLAGEIRNATELAGKRNAVTRSHGVD